MAINCWQGLARRVSLVLVVVGIGSCALPADDEQRWMGLDGVQLPFRSEEEILDFLRRAEIVSVQDIPIGVTKPRVAILERDGVRARAVLHNHHVVKERQRMWDGSFILHFRDSYTNQVAAWEVARLLSMTNTPPTVAREVDGEQVSVQLWIESARQDSDRGVEGFAFPDPVRAYRQVYDMDVFDALINNLDRTRRNFLWGLESWDIWLIDHTRAFGRDRTVLDPEKIRKCSWKMWESLQNLDTALLDARLEPYLSKLERSALVERQQALIVLIEALIEREGEDNVLFSRDDPSPSS